MKKIGILYICTGAYNVFWKDFYVSFEEKFLPDFEKHYYVFTDSESIFGENENDRIHKKMIENLPWPLITLFRFRTFLSIEESLKKMDYLMFSNANIVCTKQVLAKNILPREEKNENLFVTAHPGYYGKKAIYAPFDRNKDSFAFVPYNYKGEYVIGAMNGGTSQAFLEMSRVLNKAIEEDLKKNIIARWHDESHLNRYIIDRNDCRILSPSYCYPVGMQVSYEPVIEAVSKAAKFDVKSFKGVYDSKKSSTVFSHILSKMGQFFIMLKYWKDKIVRSRVNTYEFKS